jgi:DNA-binding response OmpR family regulator
MKVLLVDDEPTSRRMLNRILVKQFGCEVIEATNGAEALDQLPKHEFAFVLLDLVMPVLNGVETLEAIRESESLSTLPVIVLSAVTEEAAVRRVLQLGVGDYLAKPLYPIQITARLQRFIATLNLPMPAPASVSTASTSRRLGGPLQNGARVLVADGDANYRQFVREVLGGDFTVSEAATGAAALHACVQAPPALVLLGEGLGPLDAERVAAKLRTLGETQMSRLFCVSPRHKVAERVASKKFDGVLARTFVPDAFRDQLARIAGASNEGPREFEVDPQLRRQLVSTVEQVFGMMLGIELEPVDRSPVPDGCVLVGAGVDIVLDGANVTLELTCAGPVATGVAMATKLGKADAAPDPVGQALAGQGELAGIIAGRLQGFLRESGRAAACSALAPLAADAMTTRLAQPQKVTVWFNAAQSAAALGVFLRTRPTLVEAAPAPAESSASAA